MADLIRAFYRGALNLLRLHPPPPTPAPHEGEATGWPRMPRAIPRPSDPLRQSLSHVASFHPALPLAAPPDPGPVAGLDKSACRPGNREDEEFYERMAYRLALERIALALEMPGSPSLIDDVPAEVERLVAEFKSLPRLSAVTGA